MTATLSAPVDGRSRWKRVRAPVLLAGGLLGLSVLLHLRDPHQSGSWGYCPWLMLTGTYCPGCGGLRAVNDLTDGDIVAAASSNLLFIASLPLIAWGWTRWLLGRWRGQFNDINARRFGIGAAVFLLVAFAFAIVRNTPFGAWLAP